MQCPDCQSELRPGAKYCPACGCYVGGDDIPRPRPRQTVNEPVKTAAAQTQNRLSPANNTPRPRTAPTPQTRQTSVRTTGGFKWTRLIIPIVIIVLLFLVGGRIVSCVSGGGSGGVTKGAISLNTDTKAAEDTVKGLLDAAKKSDERAISKYYLGDQSDFLVEASTPTLVTQQQIYDDIFKEAFGAFADMNSAKPKVSSEINDKLHNFDYQIIETMPLGNLLDKNPQGARVRVKVDSTNFRWAEEYAEYDMIDLLIEKMGDKGMEIFKKTLLGEYNKYGATDWIKMIGEDTIEWLQDSVNFYYSSLDKRLDEAPLVSSQSGTYLDFIVVRDGNDWKVAPMRGSDIYYLWGGYTGKFGNDIPNKDIRYSTSADYFPEVTKVSAISMPLAECEAGKITDAKEVKIDNDSAAKLTNVRYGKDAIGRWIIAGTVENTGNDGATIEIITVGDGTVASGLSFEKAVLLSNVTSHGAYTNSKAGLTVLSNMKKGEKRDFVLYPTDSSDYNSFIIDISSVNISAFPMPDENIKDVSDAVQVSVDSVSYDLLGATTVAPSLVITGRIKNTSNETLTYPNVDIILTENGLPMPALNKEEDGHVFGVASAEAGNDGRTKMPDSLAPGEEAEFSIHCETNTSTADGIFLHLVAASQ